MPYKDPEARKAYHRTYSREHYLKNRAAVVAKTIRKKKKLREEWRKYKATLKCSKCGFSHPAALDFHHTDPSKKEGNIHRLISNGQATKARTEADKCIILCANCHRIHHHEEKSIPKGIKNTKPPS
jgi:hypothetical protein